MLEQAKNLLVAITLSVLAYLRPIEGELWSLFLIFFVNFLFGYLSDMIAHGEEWNNRKALRCVGEATVFFVLCAAIYAIGRLKGQMQGSLQCVSFVTYVVIYFYGLNVLRNCKKIFREGTAPWQVVSVLYYVLRFKFVEEIPWLQEYLNVAAHRTASDAAGTEAGGTASDAAGTAAEGGTASDAAGTAAGKERRGHSSRGNHVGGGR